MLMSQGLPFYAMGGAMAFDKIKWEALGDLIIYTPFCWEDIDISYRVLRGDGKCFMSQTARLSISIMLL